MKSTDDPDPYYLAAGRRHALWQNEISMFIVLVIPVIVAAFWYGSTIQMFGFDGQVTVPSSVSRGVGLALLIGLVVTIGGAVRLFVQPVAERVSNAQPVRGNRRLCFAAFDGLLVGLTTFQSLAGVPLRDVLVSDVVPVALAGATGLIAFVSMHSMVDIPRDPDARSSWLQRAHIDNA